VRLHREVNVTVLVHDRESGRMMLAWKHAPASYSIEERASVAARNEHSLALDACRIRPLDGDPMRRVLAGKTQDTGQASGPYLLQADETDPYE